ncbi:hypothetical protein AGMMS49546_34690 [Spirochaetia bacterium]|nr:hypothetical protein AGMMS49546_34690 [Spirochaetia bacterium]
MTDILVKWNDNLSVGNALIDSQHQELVRLTNELYAGTMLGGTAAKVHFMKAVQGVMAYVKEHFSAEEGLMQQVNYPEYAEHKRQHEDFVVELFNAVRKFDNEESLVAEGLVKYLMDWILEHIAGSDKKYMPYLADLNKEK